MPDANPESFLDRARAAARQSNLAAMHTYYALSITANPADPATVLDEYLQRSRGAMRTPPKVVDVSADGALNINRLLPAQAPLKILEASLERLKENPFDLDALHKMGKAAALAQWHGLAVSALSDVLKHSPNLRAAGNKLQREIKFALGRSQYALKRHAEALAVLAEFQHDPATPKDVIQLIKDASATQASEAFLKHDKAFTLATAQSIALATKAPAERDSEELAALEAAIAEKNAEPGKLIAAALRLAELLLKSQRFDAALAMLAEVEPRAGNPLDLARRAVEIGWSKRAANLEKRRSEAVRTPALRAEILELERERDEFAWSSYSSLVRRAPSDGELHLRYGEALFARWKRSNDEATLKEAIVQFQFDFKQDEHGHRARLMLAECFLAIALPGAAEVVLAGFIAQLSADSAKKEPALFLEAHYLLGIVRERLDDEKGATAAYLAVIGKDIGYKDAFERLRAMDARRRENDRRPGVLPAKGSA